MYRFFPLLTLLAFLLLSPLAPAEKIYIDNSYRKAAASGIVLPRRGSTMKQVRAGFGKPRKIHPAVGNPPITRWEYSRFIVYFERNRVITSVLKHPR